MSLSNSLPVLHVETGKTADIQKMLCVVLALQEVAFDALMADQLDLAERAIESSRELLESLPCQAEPARRPFLVLIPALNGSE